MLPPNNDLEAITNAAEAAGAAFESDPAARLKAVEDRLATLEIVQEEAQKREFAGVEMTGYIKELREELKDLRLLRSIYGFLAICLIGLLAIMLLSLIFVSGSPLYTLPAYPAAVTIIALVTGMVILTLTLAKGVHRSSVDRAKEDTTVEVPQLVTELLKQLGR